MVISLFESKNVPVQQAWGLTETAPFATYLPTELTYEKAGSAGLPMPHTQVRVVDPATGEPIEEPHQRGELWVSGPNVTGGYWEDEGALRQPSPMTGSTPVTSVTATRTVTTTWSIASRT
ncbi:AMP-binding protein [Kocuria atrinae]|uniref:AMP-binding protein n=1 Tax=Kocuria atrinae TaxID=592377 RepID=UPI0002D6FAEC|nr:AMP-binding protein [Kocuria atrinae]